MKKLITLILSLAMAFTLSACGATETTSSDSSAPSANPETTESETNEPANPSTTPDASESNEEESDTSKVLVAFFSRTGENYQVGVIEKGNTHIIADMIAEEMGADTFEIARVTPYPEAYEDCIAEAQAEQNDNVRPELTATVDNFDDYDTIFLGYPNWWGDMPMPVYTFLESYDFTDKTVIPFCTHAGSGLSGTERTIANELAGATVLDGLAIPGTTAQNDQDEARNDVTEWLDELGLTR